jgi:pimeloyl-ACP methyl ester carboxylesterase
VFEPQPGVQLHYEVAGHGSETLVVPNPGTVQDLEPLARGRRMVVLHSRGRGGSAPIADPALLGLRQEADDVVALADHLGQRRVALLGWSYVGFVAALCAATYPERISRLVLMCPAPSYHDSAWPEVVPPPELRALLDRAQASAGDAAEQQALCREQQRLVLRWRTGDQSAAGRRRDDPCQWENEWPANMLTRSAAMMRSGGDIDLLGQLGAITAPTLVVHGDADVIPLAGSEAYARLIPDARLMRLPGVGHFPHLEAPNAFFAAVDAFLRGRWPDGAVESGPAR